jgi:hypothetical protein
VEDYVDSAVKQALQIHLQPNEGEKENFSLLSECHSCSGRVGSTQNILVCWIEK